MLRWYMLVLLVAAVSAGCNDLQKIKVKMQWAQAYNEGLSREYFAQAIWRAFFQLEPSARRFFTRVRGDDIKSPTFQAHALRVLGGLDMSISLMDDKRTFTAQMSHLQAQHIEREIPGYYFKQLGRVLAEVVPASIGRCYDQAAWASCYGVLVDKIRANRENI